MNDINQYINTVFEQPIFAKLKNEEQDTAQYWDMKELLYTDDVLEYWLTCLVLADNNVFQAEHFYNNYLLTEVYDKYVYRLTFNNREAKNGRL